jgi:hypothetical protein
MEISRFYDLYFSSWSFEPVVGQLLSITIGQNAPAEGIIDRVYEVYTY